MTEPAIVAGLIGGAVGLLGLWPSTSAQRPAEPDREWWARGHARRREELDR